MGFNFVKFKNVYSWMQQKRKLEKLEEEVSKTFDQIDELERDLPYLIKQSIKEKKAIEIYKNAGLDWFDVYEIREMMRSGGSGNFGTLQNSSIGISGDLYWVAKRKLTNKEKEVDLLVDQVRPFFGNSTKLVEYKEKELKDLNVILKLQLQLIKQTEDVLNNWGKK